MSSLGRFGARRLVVIGAAAALGSGLASVGLVSAAAPAGATPSCAGTTTITCTFSETGGSQSFTVPTGVSQVTVDALGAAGGANNLSNVGLGGETIATLSVNGGDTLQVLVGGQGGGLGTSVGSAGFNGGGPGGAGGHGSPTGAPGSGGGGASDVRTGTCAATSSCALSARVVVAGGGGGSVGAGGTFTGQGGGGGNPSGGTGATGPDSLNDGGGGGGGGQTAPGGGKGAAPACGGGVTDGTAGGSVTQDGGGTGGQGSSSPGGTSGGGGGGGGGGGYFGGGGGGGGCAPSGHGGAGGGGSSFGPSGATFNNATNSGNGQVTISYTNPCTGLPITNVGGTPATGTAGSTYTGSFTVSVTNCTGGALHAMKLQGGTAGWLSVVKTVTNPTTGTVTTKPNGKVVSWRGFNLANGSTASITVTVTGTVPKGACGSTPPISGDWSATGLDTNNNDVSSGASTAATISVTC